MSQRKAYQKPQTSVRDRLRKEWVALDGGEVCCWELTAAEMMELGERSARPAIDPRGGVNTKAAGAWLIALSTRYGDELDAARVWDDMSFEEVLDLRSEEFTRLTDAISRVMGTSATELEHLEAFTGAPEAPNTSESTPFASNNSTGSRRRSTSRTAS